MVSSSNEVWLHDKFSGRDWFDSVAKDQFGRIVVYVKSMNHETLHDIPLQLGGDHVLVHYVSSKTCTPNQFVQPQQEKPIPLVQLKEIIPVVEELEELDNIFLEDELDFLAQELDRLERICGSNYLQDIFYEVHDGKNAVTNLSTKFPEVCASMQKLYDNYGFDVVYEELDG